MPDKKPFNLENLSVISFANFIKALCVIIGAVWFFSSWYANQTLQGEKLNNIEDSLEALKLEVKAYNKEVTDIDRRLLVVENSCLNK